MNALVSIYKARRVQGHELKAIRHSLGLNSYHMGLALGYGGSRASIEAQIRAFECGQRNLPLARARLAIMLGWHGVPEDWILPGNFSG